MISKKIPNSDSLGLLTLKADGRRRVHGARPGRGASQCPGGGRGVGMSKLTWKHVPAQQGQGSSWFPWGGGFIQVSYC